MTIMENNTEKKRVLIVEDDGDIRESLSEFLQSEGYRVITADNGKAALESILPIASNPSEKVDLILLDLMMPVMNGIEFRKAQLCEPSIATIPVIVISADNRTQAIANENGLRRCVLKPMSLDDLLIAIEEDVIPDAVVVSPMETRIDQLGEKRNLKPERKAW